MDSEEPQQTSSGKKGFLDRLRAKMPDVVTDNAPRIVSALKAMGSVTMMLSRNRVFSFAGAGFVLANGIIILFGKKKTEAEKEKLRSEKHAAEPKGVLADYTTKVLHPRQYPIEAGTSIGMVSSTLWTLSGLFGKGGFSPGRLVGGALSLASDSNIVLTKERIGEPEANPNRKGTFAYYRTELRHRPVLLSSLLNIGCDITSIVGGVHEYRKGKEPNTLIVGLFLLSANLFQALFVNKNDYNIERKTEIPSAQNAGNPPHEAPQPSPAGDSHGTNQTWEKRVNSQLTGSMALQS